VIGGERGACQKNDKTVKSDIQRKKDIPMMKGEAGTYRGRSIQVKKKYPRKKTIGGRGGLPQEVLKGESCWAEGGSNNRGTGRCVRFKGRLCS